MLDKEELIRESEQLRILKNYIKLSKKAGKPIVLYDLENLVEAMDQYDNLVLKKIFRKHGGKIKC